MEIPRGCRSEVIATLAEHVRLLITVAELAEKYSVDLRPYHADPHPENLIVMRDGTVGVIYCGMARRFQTGCVMNYTFPALKFWPPAAAFLKSIKAVMILAEGL